MPIKSLMNDEIAFEHLHRYHSASELVRGKSVLDIACGEGYGTALLAQYAGKAIGVDIDPACIEYAREKYKGNNIEFVEGRADAIPLKSGSMDIVVSYETIEHLEEKDQHAFLKEIRRVLKKDGKLIISTPDKANYTERFSHKNEFHIKEFTKDEFVAFLGTHFKHTKNFSQGYEIVDAITEERPEEVKDLHVSNWERDTRPFARTYLISICSNMPLDERLPFASVVFQVSREYLPLMDRVVEMEAHILELGAWGRRLDKEALEKDELIRRHEQSINRLEEEKTGRIDGESFLRSFVQQQLTTIENLSHTSKAREERFHKQEEKFREQEEKFHKQEDKFRKVEDKFQRQEEKSREQEESFQRQEKELAAELTAKEERIVVLKNKLQLLSFDRDSKVRDFEESNTMLTKQSETITFLKQKFEMQAEQLQQLEKREADSVNIVNEQIERISSLNYQLDAVNGRLSEIYGSEGWKLLSLYYKFKGKAIPENSGRYRFLKKAFNTLRGKKEHIPMSPSPADKILAEVALPDATRESYDIITFPVFEFPTVSIVLPAYNGWHLTYNCLESIKANTFSVSYEIIIADDASSDETKNIQEYIKNIVVIRQEKNLEFLHNCNTAAEHARGKYILFLNNDTIVTPGWLSSLIDLMENDPTIGMTGSKLIYPDGRLQEAGGILWKDGSAWNYGHNQDPQASQFNYVKEADYISGASIAIRTDLWKKIGGFDTLYSPAYCEDSDLAFEVRKHGYKVVYQPLSEIIHYEGYTHGTDKNEGIKGTEIKAYQRLNNEKLKEKWKEVLQKEHFPNGENVFWARDKSQDRKTILVIDHYVPHFDKDAGSRTVYQYLKLFVSLNFNVKFIGDNFCRHEPYTTVLQQMGIEVLYGPDYAVNWQQWIKDNSDKFDFVLMNRPHITIKYIDFVRENTKATILYYGHDLHFVRERKQYEIEKDAKLLASAEQWEKTETYIFSKSDIVLTPSDDETNIINQITGRHNARTILPYFFEHINPPISDFSARRDLLFVGGFNHRPNVDAVIWFVREVFPLIKKAIPGVKFIVVGSNTPPEISAMNSGDVEVKGFLSENELAAVYDAVRLAVIPLRYGAGVKGKTVEALHKGLPLVATSIGVEGLPGDYSFIYVADEAKKFAAKISSLYSDESELMDLSKKGISYIEKNFAIDTAKSAIREILETSS